MKQKEQRVMELKEKVRTLIETPLHLNLELIENDLFTSVNDES